MAVGYDADSGRLTVCPESAAWATKTRLEQAGIIAAANTSAGGTVVRHLRILASGSVPAPDLDDVVPIRRPHSRGPGETRELASDGYHRTLATHWQAAPPDRPGNHGGRRTADQGDTRADPAGLPGAEGACGRPAAPIEAARVATTGRRPPTPWRCAVPRRSVPPGRPARRPSLLILPRCVQQFEHVDRL
ncbi:DciA family protein [Streptomyces sp. V4I2]|uniref:DciA family protein n=1 Tax=Streptomyces sp. V4I2 TaxID=3042280 RepID=UPI0027D88F76|nr:DciA family protein [Streptomyces sp. V4I2]